MVMLVTMPYFSTVCLGRPYISLTPEFYVTRILYDLAPSGGAFRE